ncbi:MAG: LytR C-terminal domain-containing protein [Actinomycetota bacterium]
MGRHSSDRRWPFYRSVVGWFMPWAIMAVIAGTAVWVAVDALGSDDLESPARVVGRTTPSPSASPTPTPESSPSSSPSPTRSASASPARSPSAPPALITEGVSVQVLNATSDPGADDRMADRLARLGFDVVAVDSASGAYPETTVFWSFPEAEPAAAALARRFGWTSAPKPENLSSTVDLHVVVGDDER